MISSPCQPGDARLRFLGIAKVGSVIVGSMGDSAKCEVIPSEEGVRLIGEFDFSALDVLQSRLPAAGASPVVVDLSECTFLDASVIAFLVGRAQAVGIDPERFLLVGAGGQVERILELTGVSGITWVRSATTPPKVELSAA
jgi:anti-anti-sigma factor